MGKCIVNLEFIILELGVNCGSSGEWVRGDDFIGECFCIVGWEKVVFEC